MGSIMGFLCTFSGRHSWNGCTCKKCGATRDEEHSWDGCVCTLCGMTRDYGHIWDGCKCTTCGKKRDENHIWGATKCNKCGAELSGEEWAGRLIEKKDYRSLAAIYRDTDFRNPRRNEKIYYAHKELINAGSEAVDAIIAELETDGYDRVRLAEILVAIGDPRAAPVIKRKLDRGEFAAYGYIPGKKNSLYEFVNKYCRDTEKMTCAICGKGKSVLEMSRYINDNNETLWFCNGVCWSKRGSIIKAGIGTNCPYYTEGVCLINGEDTGLCSLMIGSYNTSCQVYAINRYRH